MTEVDSATLNPMTDEQYQALQNMLPNATITVAPAHAAPVVVIQASSVTLFDQIPIPQKVGALLGMLVSIIWAIFALTMVICGALIYKTVGPALFIVGCVFLCIDAIYMVVKTIFMMHMLKDLKKHGQKIFNKYF